VKKALFLDRDGTINEEVGFLHEVEKIRILEGAAEVIKKARQKGYLIIVISNQSGVGRGYFGIQEVEKVNQGIKSILGKEGAGIDAFYFCPHSPDDNCSCRKPSPGLFLKAAKEWDIDLSSSLCVGDRVRDVEAGIRAGIKQGFLLLGDMEGESSKLKDLLLDKQQGPRVEVIKNLREILPKL